MIFEKRITSITGSFDAESCNYSVTYQVYSDDWRDGPCAIAIQGSAEKIVDNDGKVLGWLKRGKPWKFGNEVDLRAVASAVEVSDRKIIDADDELEITNNGLTFERNKRRRAIVRWTVKQNFKKRSFESEEPDKRPREDDFFTLKYAKEFVDVPFIRDVRTGALIVNSAGDPFIPTPTRKVAIRCFSLVRKERRNKCKLYDRYENVVNKDKWYDFEPGTVLMESITPDWDGTIFTVTYSFKHNPLGWGEKFLDTGLRESRIEEIKVDGKPVKVRRYFEICSPGSEAPV
jgi:hypothetical protein